MKRSLEETARRFDEMAETYDLTLDTWVKRGQAKVIEMARPKAGDVVIDIGTGTGWLALAVAKRVKEVVAVDISPKMLEKTVQKVNAAKLKNVAVEYGSFQDISRKAARLKGATTLIVSNFAMHHLDDAEKRRAIEDMADLLAPTGRIVLGDFMFFEDPSRYEDMYDPEVDDPSRAEDLESMFRAVGLTVTTSRLHPIVGVIRAER